MNFERIIITEETQQAFCNLLESYKGKNENDIQRKFAIFMQYAQNELNIDYYGQLREQSEKGDDKTKLINILKFVGEPDKVECMYLYDWSSLFDKLLECNIIDKEQEETILNKIEKIFNKS